MSIQTLHDSFETHMAKCQAIQTAIDGVDQDNGWETLERLELELSQSILSVGVKRLVDICLYWGGPSGGFEVQVSQDGENDCIDSVTFYHCDWGTREERQLTDDEVNVFLTAYSGVLLAQGIDV